jgi:hypothetical protein
MPKGGRSQSWDALQYYKQHGKSIRYEAEKEFVKNFRAPPGIVLSDIDPVFLNALLPKAFIAAPLDGDHHYCYSRLWHYGTAEAIKLINRGLSRSMPIYALLLSSEHVDRGVERLPLINGHSWERSDKSSKKVVVMTLIDDSVTQKPASLSSSRE